MSTISASTTSTTAYKVTADTTGSLVLQTGSTPTTAMTIDTSQNVGIGTSSPTYTLDVTGNTRTTGYAAINTTPSISAGLRIGQSADQTLGTAYSILFSGVGYSGGISLDATSMQIGQNSGSRSLTFHSGTSFAERMRIDTSGNVGIGTSSPNSGFSLTTQTPIYVNNQATDITPAAVGWSGQVTVKGNGYSGGLSMDSTGLWVGHNSGSRAVVFAINATERARIDSSGNLLVGTTAQQTGASGKISVAGGTDGVAGVFTNNSNSIAYTLNVFNYTTSTGAGVGRYIKFAMGSTPTQTGSIIGDGTNTAFNTSSDYRLKENITPMAGALDLVMKQRPVTWTWKSNGKAGKGFIAHWLQEDGAGECVTGEKDAVDENGNPDYQGVDTSFLVATLTAAIQEQQAIIQTLTSRIEVLEAK